MTQVLTQEQELLQGIVREFSQGEILSKASKIDLDSKVPDELLRKLPELGLYGIVVPSPYGGAGADFTSLLLTVEELSKVSGTIGARIAFHGIVCSALNESGNESLRSSVLPKLAGRTLSAFSVDPKSTISYKKSGNELVLEGTSEYVLNADVAGVFLFLARSKDGSSVIVCVEKERVGDGIEVGEPKKMMGLRGSGTSRVSLHNLDLTESSLLFPSAETSSAVQRFQVAGRLAVASQSLGIGQAALNEEIKYANERSQFNTKIGRFYAVQDFIASDEISIDSARSVTYDVASSPLNEESAGRRSAAAKILASNAAVQTARHSIRVHGGYGFIRDYPVERYLRDARAMQIYLESNEALKAKIAEDLLSR